MHGLALLLDRTVPFHVADLLVPGIAPYRPVWTGLGVLAAELMLLVYVSFSLRKRIGTQNWRRLRLGHVYPIFALATAHGLLAGTDSGTAWALALYGGAVGAVLAAAAWRIVVPPSRASRSFQSRLRVLRCRLAGGGMRPSACRAPDVSAGVEFFSGRRWARSAVRSDQLVPYGRDHANPPADRQIAWDSPHTTADVGRVHGLSQQPDKVAVVLERPHQSRGSC